MSLGQLFMSHWILGIVIALSAYVLVTTLWTAFGSELRNIPGPFAARFTRLYLFRQATKGNAHTLYNDLHQQYGPIVRVAPGKVSLADPETVPIIYNTSSKYRKADFYSVFTSTFRGKKLDNLFATQDLQWHKSMKSTVAHFYSLSYLRQLEPLVDECIVLFEKAMNDRDKQPIDFGEWLQWYAFDVIGNLTFSQTFGFLETGKDSRNIIAGLEGGTKYNTVVGQLPELHPWLLGNEKLMKSLQKIPAVAKSNPVITLNAMIREAMSSYNDDDTKQRNNFNDFLQRAREKDAARLQDSDIATSLLSNLFAGSDTTGMALKAVFYFLVKNPDVCQKLVAEIDAADREGRLSPVIELQQAQELKYLQAVIKEALRLHPGVGVPLERIVPEGGATMSGHFLPTGTVVGVNAWVNHHNEDIFGRDAHEFRPERWLEGDAEHIRRMERNFLSFGSGSRVCLGKNISMLEMYKVVPQILRRFHVEWASAKDEWDIAGYFFAKQNGLIMKLSKRDKAVT